MMMAGNAKRVLAGLACVSMQSAAMAQEAPVILKCDWERGMSSGTHTILKISDAQWNEWDAESQTWSAMGKESGRSGATTKIRNSPDRYILERKYTGQTRNGGELYYFTIWKIDRLSGYIHLEDGMASQSSEAVRNEFGKCDKAPDPSLEPKPKPKF